MMLGGATLASRHQNLFVAPSRLLGFVTANTITRHQDHKPVYHHRSEAKACGRLSSVRSYFTNGQVTKKDDPYAILGLRWGDGATTAEIRQAFRAKAKELHPDVVDKSKMSLDQAQQEFQKLVRAYEALLKHVQADADHESIEEWRVALWRQSDRIALDRTDVAGSLRKRPSPPAQTESRKGYGRELGHPSGKGTVLSRGEYLSSGRSNNGKGKLRSSSVGRGQSKWVQSSRGKEYKEWKP